MLELGQELRQVLELKQELLQVLELEQELLEGELEAGLDLSRALEQQALVQT